MWHYIVNTIAHLWVSRTVQWMGSVSVCLEQLVQNQFPTMFAPTRPFRSMGEGLETGCVSICTLHPYGARYTRHTLASVNESSPTIPAILSEHAAAFTMYCARVFPPPQRQIVRYLCLARIATQRLRIFLSCRKSAIVTIVVPTITAMVAIHQISRIVSGLFVCSGYGAPLARL